MRTNSGRSRFRCRFDEKGNVLFYVLCLLPLLLSLSAVVVDVSAWYELGDELQQSADLLALRAAQFLPDHDAAAQFARDSVLPGRTGQTGEFPSGTQASVFFPAGSTQSVGIELQVQYRAGLSALFPHLEKQKFLIRKQAVAELSPLDVVFILPDGESLRPGILSRPSQDVPMTLSRPWGEPASWPASGYFRCAEGRETTSPAQSSSWDWWHSWGDENFQRWVTQTCFNPSLSPLKLGMIAILDELQAGKENRISVIYSPGDEPNQGFSVLKSLEEPSAEGSQVRWSGHTEEDSLLGDELCMLLSEAATAGTDHFLLPKSISANQHEHLSRSCPEREPSFPCGGRHRLNTHLSDCFLRESLALRQAVYWRMARGGGLLPNIPAALHEALRQLSANSFGAEQERVESSRKNLRLHPARGVILVSDYLPEPEFGTPSLREELLALNSLRVSLTIIGYAHEHLDESRRSALLERARLLSSYQSSGTPLRVRIAKSSEELAQHILPEVLLKHRHPLLRE